MEIIINIIRKILMLVNFLFFTAIAITMFSEIGILGVFVCLILFIIIHSIINWILN